MQLLHANATYGKLNQAQLDLQPGLNVICAPNEGGKSTWSRFLLTMFYGLNTRQRGDLADKNRFQPWNGTPMQGRLELSVGEKLLVLSRRTQRTDAPMGVFSCTYAGTDTPVSDLDAAHCGETLLGVPQSVYQRCAFIPSGSMAINADADLERRINALISTGEEKVSFLQAENRLKKQLHQRKYNRTGAIPQLEAEIGEFMAARAEVKSLAEQETFLHSQLLQAQQEQKERLLIRQREIQRQAEEKQQLLQQLPDSATLQNINEQLGAVRSLAEQAQQAEDAAKQQDAAIQVQLQELNRTYRGKLGAFAPEGDPLTDAYYEQLCAYLRAAVQEIFTNLDNRQRRYLLAAKKYLGEHYMDSSLSLDGVAAQLGISPSYLSRIFSEIDGKRFTQYLSDLRIEKAKLLLADDSRLVRDIGQDVGFLTIQNFMRVFKAKTGVTPSEYRSTLPKNS